MTVWLVINSAGLLLLVVVQWIVLRQIGAMLARLGPVGARPVTEGPRVGENLSPWFSELHGERGQGVPTLYVFASTGCPACGSVREEANSIARHWLRRAEIVFVYDTESADVTKRRPDDYVRSWSNSRLRASMGISMVPFAVMTDHAGVVLDQGLVNRADNLEEMLDKASDKQPIPAVASETALNR